ncbi:hypothetical protein BKI52_19980 [marine bacterium AO1-C]|nr:hypothetical protein BKI52_19980 [marine bacterium AO1-C]
MQNISVKLLFTLAIGFYLITSALPAQSQDSMEGYVSKAVDEYSKGNFGQAIKLYDEAMKKFGEHPAIYVLKAEAYAKGKNDINSGKFDPNGYRLALESLNRALQLAPESPQVFQTRGKINLVYRQFKEAVEDFTLTLKYTKDKETIYQAVSDRATAKMLSQDFDGAIQDFESSIKMKPENANSYINLGGLYDMKNDHKKSEETYLKGLKYDPKNALLMNNLGFLFVRTKQFKTALKWLNQAIEVDPKMAYAYGNRGYSKFMLGKVAEGKKDIDIAVKIGPNNPFAFKYRAIYYIKQKEYALACADLQKANELGYSQTYGDEVNNLIKKHCK